MPPWGMVQNTVTSTGSVAAKLASNLCHFLCKSPLRCIAHIHTRCATQKSLLLNHAPGAAWFKTRLQTPGSVAAKLAVNSVPFSVQIAPVLALHCTYTHEMCNPKGPVLNHAPGATPARVTSGSELGF